MPYAGICKECPVFIWKLKELDVYQAINKHKREHGHTKKLPKVWKISKLEYGFYEMNKDRPWFSWWVANYIVRNIPPSPEALRHLQTLPVR